LAFKSTKASTKGASITGGPTTPPLNIPLIIEPL
jgi:hypothetical protein